MCRLLCVRSAEDFSIPAHLEKFALIAKNSKEYQGHGWGCAFKENGEWRIYKTVAPIWEDDFSRFGSTKLLIAHARSAYMDRDIIVENNMPFIDEQTVFIFNGELQGVRISEKGRIGAEKIFNFILRFDKGDLKRAMEKALPIIEKKTRYIKAMNMIIANTDGIFVSSQFNEDADYFTMYFKQEDNRLIICSEYYPNQNNWQKIETKKVKVF